MQNVLFPIALCNGWNWNESQFNDVRFVTIGFVCENWRERKCKCVRIGVCMFAHGKRMQQYSSKTPNRMLKEWRKSRARVTARATQEQVSNAEQWRSSILSLIYTYFITWEFVGIWSELFLSPTMNEPSSITWMRYVAHTTRLKRKFSAFVLQILSSPPIVPCQMHAEYHTICLVSHIIYIDSRLPHCVSWDGWSFFIMFVWRWNDVAFYCRWCSRVKHL